MSIRDDPHFEEKLANLQELMKMRGEARSEIDQRHITIDSIINRLDALKSSGQLKDRRFLTIGDADFTGLAVALFGDPSEVVVTDIDDRLSEIYFEATMEYDLPVRFVYHDMRIKMIAILKDQYSPVLLEPPRTKAGVEVFLSRAIQMTENEHHGRIFCTIPANGPIREHFDNLLPKMKLNIIKNHGHIIEYEDDETITSEYIELQSNADSMPTTENHYIRPFYENEVAQKIYEYKCICRQSINVGEGQDFSTIEELEEKGCKECGYVGVFAFKSDIQLK